MPFFDCDECVYGTTSPRHADTHEDDTGHGLTEHEDE